jgi:hypothetical protein
MVATIRIAKLRSWNKSERPKMGPTSFRAFGWRFFTRNQAMSMNSMTRKKRQYETKYDIGVFTMDRASPENGLGQVEPLSPPSPSSLSLDELPPLFGAMLD